MKSCVWKHSIISSFSALFGKMARRSVCWKFQLFCLFIILLIQASKSIPSECNNYQILSDGTRSVQSTLNNENVLCDRSLSTGWYRFMGEAGTQLPEQPVGNIYGKPYSCHTHAVSWLTTPHPRFGEGSVSRTVCFSWNGDNCHYTSVSILVINCDGYFVYYLSGTPSCYYRYCANRGNTGMTYLNWTVTERKGEGVYQSMWGVCCSEYLEGGNIIMITVFIRNLCIRNLRVEC